MSNTNIDRSKDERYTPHPSHDMGEWESSIVTILETPRFGSIRECRKCGGEHAKTAAGQGMHDELRRPCNG